MERTSIEHTMANSIKITKVTYRYFHIVTILFVLMYAGLLLFKCLLVDQIAVTLPDETLNVTMHYVLPILSFAIKNMHTLNLCKLSFQLH